MLRCALRGDRSRRAVVSSQHAVARFFSDEKLGNQNSSTLRTSRPEEPDSTAQQTDVETVNYRYRNDGSNETKEAMSGAEAQGKKFVPFFQEVDKLDSKAGIESFFGSLGDVPPAQPKSTMPTQPQPATASQPPPYPPSTASTEANVKASSLGGRSIFDAFPIPDAPLTASPNAYEEGAYRQYRDVIDEVLNDERYRRMHTSKPLTEEFVAPIRTWLQAAETNVEYNLPLLRTSVEQGLNSMLSDSDMKTMAESFRNELDVQREAFLKHIPLSDKQYNQASVALQTMGSLCAKRARSLPLEVAWEKVKEAGMRFDKTALNSYLYSCTVYVSRRKGGVFTSLTGDSVLDMLGSVPSTTNVSKATDEKKDEDEEYFVNLPEEVATFHDLLYDPTEASVTIRIKAFVAKGDASGAEALLNRFAPKREEARQRTYLPILRCYLEQGDISSGLRLFKQMRDTPTCIHESETYIQLLSAIAECGYFSNDSSPIEGAEELGYSSPCGSKLFDQLVSEMAEDVLEITSASARRLYGAFESALREQDSDREFVEMHPLAPLSIENDPATDDELIVSRTVVADDTGICPRSGAKLRLFNLDIDEREQTRNTLLKLAESAYLAWTGKEGQDDDHALVALSEFANWLDTREGEPFTAFLDGPNIAYFMQNFDQGKFNVFQIEFMVRALENMGETPLVIMPYKYCLPSFSTSGSARGAMQHLNDEEAAVLERLFKQGKLYRVPKGCLDDYYWMLASVSDQKLARGDRNMEVHPDDGSGRWPGTRPMLLSNDQMRDHKLELLEPRLFRRWYSCYIVNYNFTAFVDDECIDKEISFSTADFFSREIQGNPTHNTDGKYCGMAWHFPVSDWETHERLCVRLPVKVSQ